MKWIKATDRLPEIGKPISFRIYERRYGGIMVDEGVFKHDGYASTYGVGSVEWLDESPSSGVNVLVERLESLLRSWKEDIDFKKQAEEKAKSRQNVGAEKMWRHKREGIEKAVRELSKSLTQYKSQPGSLQGEQLIWKEGKTLVFDWTVLFSESYNFEGLELMAQETKTPIGRVVIWPDRLGANKKWALYFEYDGWLKQDFNSEEEVKKAVEDAVKKELASQSPEPPTPQPSESITFLQWVGNEGWKWSELNSRWFKYGSDDYLNETQLHELFKERDVAEEYKSDREPEAIKDQVQLWKGIIKDFSEIIKLGDLADDNVKELFSKYHITRKDQDKKDPFGKGITDYL